MNERNACLEILRPVDEPLGPGAGFLYFVSNIRQRKLEGLISKSAVT